MGNDRILAMMQEARYQFFNSLGYKDEKSIEGMGTIQADAAVVYKGEAFHGDQIDIQLAIDNITRKSFDVYYHLWCGGERNCASKNRYCNVRL